MTRGKRARKREERRKKKKCNPNSAEKISKGNGIEIIGVGEKIMLETSAIERENLKQKKDSD